MGPKTAELITVLDKMIILLAQDGETHWGAWLSKCKARLEASDFSGVTLLLGAYGGMGSFSDLVICQTKIDGKFAWKPDYQEKNEQLDSLRGQAWKLADALRRAHKP